MSKKKSYRNDLTVLDHFIMTLAFAGICPTDTWSNTSLTALLEAVQDPQSAS